MMGARRKASSQDVLGRDDGLGWLMVDSRVHHVMSIRRPRGPQNLPMLGIEAFIERFLRRDISCMNIQPEYD